MAAPTVKSVDEELGELTREVRDFGKGMADLRNDFTGFRSAVETELRLIRKLGGWFVGGLFGVFISVVVGAATVAGTPRPSSPRSSIRVSASRSRSTPGRLGGEDREAIGALDPSDRAEGGGMTMSTITSAPPAMPTPFASPSVHRITVDEYERIIGAASRIQAGSSSSTAIWWTRWRKTPSTATPPRNS